ncbi:MAG: hypothetical protein HQ562_03595 [Candidatus Marinimicrobia bacterium]|nr:hypothetical protein [Candidatus Neomarinimicrobiota bacterium]
MSKKTPLVIISVILMLSFSFAQDQGTATVSKGGINPCLASCCIGPRVGLEMNEGKEITTSEWIGFGSTYLWPIHPTLPTIGKAYMAYDMGGKTNSMEGFFASFCLGPRIGNELDHRKIRTMEWLRLVPCVNIYPAIAIPLEAYNGKTMTEIEVKENLRK